MAIIDCKYVILLVCMLGFSGCLTMNNQETSDPMEHFYVHDFWPNIPDISDCDKVVMELRPYATRSYRPVPLECDIFDAQEKEGLKSWKTIVLQDENDIGYISLQLQSCPFHWFRSRPADVVSENHTILDCYWQDKTLRIDLSEYRYMTVQGGKGMYVYEYTTKTKIAMFPNMIRIVAKYHPFADRIACAKNLLALYQLKSFVKKHMWVTSVVYESKQRIIQDHLRCPGAHRGTCHYALNSNWHRDSDPNVVFLFESNGQCNLQGGPELFNFDNHEPKGGCVLLNDGSVKFIRTQEELESLRWE